MKIKGFDKNLQCRGFQFEIGKEYKIELNGRKLELCTDTCFHYCDSLQQVHQFYNAADDNRFCEIEVLGEEISDGKKCGSNHIKIVREITGDELNQLKGLTNGNTGLFNSGNFNSGYYNSGNYNSGDANSGNFNSGDRNSGYRNSGNFNSGDLNSGDRNSGYLNSGYLNSGNYNSGDHNSGNFNSGDSNSGNYNSGYSNSGYFNSGSYNSGNYNSGDYNSGSHNSGNYNSGYSNSGYFNSGSYNSGNYNSGYSNSGYFNSCDNSNGVFCTEEPKINIFNMPTDMTMREFVKSKYYTAIFSSPFNLTKWIEYTAEEKAQDEKKALIGGYLQIYSYKEACQNWWANMSPENKEIIKSMPNFNAEIFKEITGIETKENE